MSEFLTLEPRFVRKGRRGGCKIAKKTLEPFSCERVAAEDVKSQKPSVFDTRTSFPAKGWPYRGALSALPAALREKRKRRRETVTEGKRERERRCDEEVKM